MTLPHPPVPEPAWVRWLSSLIMAGILAYACYPLISTLLLLAEGFDEQMGKAFMPIMLTAQIVIFLLAARWFLTMPEVPLRFERGCWWSGIMMLLSLPLLLLIFLLELPMGAGSTPDQGVAAFFMLIIFGGYYGMIGGILLLVGFILRRRRKDAML